MVALRLATDLPSRKYLTLYQPFPVTEFYEWAQIHAAGRQTLLKKLDETKKIAGPPLGRFPN
jgi:hypothetical protein